MLLSFVLYGCIEAPKELPPSRFVHASTGTMIQFDSMRGFLVTRGEATQVLLWKVETLDEATKNCALQQIPNNTKALVIENHVEQAQAYLRNTITPSSFSCSP